MSQWKVEFIETAKRGVFEGLSFGAAAGAVTVLLGDHGAGKTTALRMLCALDRPDDGAVIVGGISVADAKGRRLRRLRRGMSVMLQGGAEGGHALFEHLTVQQNLAFAMRAAGHVSAGRIDGIADLYLQRAGLACRAQDLPSALSADDRKRVAVARALSLRAPLTILDDLDGGVTAETRAQLCTLLREECEDRAATYVVATRSPATARAAGDITVGIEPRVKAVAGVSELTVPTDWTR